MSKRCVPGSEVEGNDTGKRADILEHGRLIKPVFDRSDENQGTRNASRVKGSGANDLETVVHTFLHCNTQVCFDPV